MAVGLARLGLGTSARSPSRRWCDPPVLQIMDLSDPMMQKALLINSAEDRGPAGWDLEWGWGSIDLYAALEQYDYTISSAALMVEPRSGIRGTMNKCQTVTLVWHKHSGQPLSNLDMYLYDATTHGFNWRFQFHKGQC